MGYTFIVVALVALFIPPLFGQPELLWLSSHTYDSAVVVMTVAESHFGGYILGGLLHKESDSGSDSSDTWIARADRFGATLWYRTYGYPYDVDYVLGVTELGNGDILAGGNGIWQLSAHGDSVRYRQLGFVHCRAIQGLPNGGAIIVGQSTSVEPGCFYCTDWRIVRFDASGDTTWTLTFDPGGAGPTEEQCYSVALAQDGGFLVVGFANTEHQFSYAYVKLSPDGEVQWRRDYPEISSVYPAQLLPVSEGYLVGNGSQLLRLSETGDVVWERQLTPAYAGLWVGATGEITRAGTDLTGATFLQRYTPDGDSVWRRNLLDSRCLWAGGFVAASGGGYLLAGNADTDPYWGTSSVWLLMSTGDGPGLEVSPNTLDFGTVTFGGSSDTLSFTVAPPPYASVTIDSVDVPGAYWLDAALPYTIWWDDSLVVSAVFTPTHDAYASYDSVVAIYTNAPNDPRLVRVIGEGALSATDWVSRAMPAASIECYPNPFNAAATISFSLPRASHVTLVACNLLGQEVATVVNSDLLAGQYRRTFDGSALPTGVYLLRLQTDIQAVTSKVVLLR